MRRTHTSPTLSSLPAARGGVALAALLFAAAGCGGTTVISSNKGDLAKTPVDSGPLFGDDDLATSDDMATGPDMASMCGAEAKRKGNTGDPCTTDKDCLAGKGDKQPGRCLYQTTELGNLTNWDNGYCTSLCDPDLNQPGAFGTNPECPGGNATCEGAGPTARCVTLCTSPGNCRPCYSCFDANLGAHGCKPSEVSQCDPTKLDSCPSGGTCQNIGYGDVGKCSNPCDPYTKMGCPGGSGGKDCHANDTNGQGFCTAGSLSGLGPGDMCVGYPINECPSGYGCLNGQCWKYCNDANKNTQCLQGALCMPMPSGLSPTKVIGICSQSN